LLALTQKGKRMTPNNDTGMPPVSRPLTLTEYADRIGVHVATIYRNVKSGRLPEPILICGRPRFTPAQIQAIESGTVADREVA
jgi:predicted site-specific integrase-resolvase